MVDLWCALACCIWMHNNIAQVVYKGRSLMLPSLPAILPFTAWSHRSLYKCVPIHFSQYTHSHSTVHMLYYVDGIYDNGFQNSVSVQKYINSETRQVCIQCNVCSQFHVLYRVQYTLHYSKQKHQLRCGGAYNVLILYHRNVVISTQWYGDRSVCYYYQGMA